MKEVEYIYSSYIINKHSYSKCQIMRLCYAYSVDKNLFTAEKSSPPTHEVDQEANTQTRHSQYAAGYQNMVRERMDANGRLHEQQTQNYIPHIHGHKTKPCLKFTHRIIILHQIHTQKVDNVRSSQTQN